jgi:hypothetical protein
MLLNDCLENTRDARGLPKTTAELVDFFSKSAAAYQTILKIIDDKHQKGELRSFLDGIATNVFDNKTVN